MEDAGREGTRSRSRGLAWRRHPRLSYLPTERRGAPESGLENMELRDVTEWPRDRKSSLVYVDCAIDTTIWGLSILVD